MSTLYIDRQGSSLRVQTGVLHVSTPDGKADRRLPVKYLDRVVLRADTQLSSQVLCALAECGVSLIALGGRGGQQIAQMAGAPHNDAQLRWQQVLTLSQPDACRRVALAIVQNKVKRQHATLARMAQDRPDLRKPFFDGQQRLGRILQTLQQPDANSTQNLSQVRGLEGAAAAMYFQAYFCAFAPALGAQVASVGHRPIRSMPHSRWLTLCFTVRPRPPVGAPD